MKRGLFVSSPIGLGHAQTDVAIARELRAQVTGLQIDWLAQDPVTRVLEAEGGRIHPASVHLASESSHFESESAGHDLHCFQAPRQPHYDGYEKWNRRHLRDNYEDFVEWFAHTIFPHPHSTRQLEEVVSHAFGTDGPTVLAATIWFDMYAREEALALAAQIRCPVLVTQNGGDAFWPKDTSGPLAQASGGRLHVFDGLGPFVTARWPVAMNLVLREFFESARSA